MDITKKFTINNLEKIKHYEFDHFIVESIDKGDEDSIVYKFKLLDKRDMKSFVDVKLSRVIQPEKYKKWYGKLALIVQPNGEKRRVQWVDKDSISSPYNFLKEIIHILETQK